MTEKNFSAELPKNHVYTGLVFSKVPNNVEGLLLNSFIGIYE
jgi:hypothetical protein